jgi:hypothetical protein
MAPCCFMVPLKVVWPKQKDNIPFNGPCRRLGHAAN